MGYDEDIEKAERLTLNEGECFDITPGLIHRAIALEHSDIIEFSTEHFDTDSYRIMRGD